MDTTQIGDEARRGRRWPRYVGGIGLLLVVLGFPLLVSWTGLRCFLEVRRQSIEQTQSQRLERLLETALPKAEPTVFLNEALRGLARRAASRGDGALSAWLDTVHRLEQRYPELFSFTVFDGDDRVVHCSDPHASRRVARELLQWIRTCRRSGYCMAHPQRTVIGPYLGISDPSYATRAKAVLSGFSSISDNPMKTWFFTHVGRQFSVFIHIHRRGFDPAIGLHALVARSLGRSTRVHLVDLQAMAAIGETDAGLAQQVMMAALQLEREPHRMLQRSGRLWRQVDLDERWRLVVSRQDDEVRAPERWLAVATLVLLGLFGAAALVLLFVLQRERMPFVSIRAKLLVLFSIAVGTPLVVLVLILVAYLGEREKILEQNAHLDSLATLRGFDGDLPTISRRTGGAIRRVFSRFPVTAPERAPQFRAWFAGQQRKWHISSVKLISSMSREIPVQIGEPANPKAGRLVAAILESLLQRATGVFDPRTQRKLAEFEMFVGTFGDGAATDFIDRFADRRGSMFSMSLGPLEGWLYCDWLPADASAPEFIYSVMWDRDDIYWLYLRRMLPPGPLADGTELLAVERNPRPVSREVVRPERPGETSGFVLRHRSIPARPVGRWFRATLSLMRLRPGVLQRRVTYRGAPYLLTGFPGDQLRGIALFALRPLAPIRAEIRSLAVQMGFFGVLSVGFTLACGLFLARQLLVPVRELSRGVEAVRRRDLRFRVSPGDTDELGELSAMFNVMLENLQEVSMARVVQDRLFPGQAMALGEYRVFGRSKPASELGGDYFDYVSVGERLLVILGDVTGHGVPAALMMAMAKATLIRCVASASSFAEIVQAFNHVFFVAGGKRTLMTTLFVEIDTVGHRVQLWNCGHPFPLRQGLDGKAAFVELGGNILGIRARPLGGPVETTLTPGERLILYTDGVVESLAATKTASAFDQYAQYVVSRPMLPPEQGCDDLLGHHPFFAWRRDETVPQPDDFTVVIIEREARPTAR